MIRRFDRNDRILYLSVLSVIVSVIVSFVAKLFMLLIDGITNLCLFFRLSLQPVFASQMTIGGWIILMPVLGSLVIAFIMKFGSKTVGGHGIPETMGQVLLNRSKIPVRDAILKPLASAIAIGTGGPFGSEGPIIATGGAIGSYIGQIFKVIPVERKTLLAAGAAAGMTAIFGTPVAAVLLAIELLLFEYRAASIIPVALSAVTARVIARNLFDAGTFLEMPNVLQPNNTAILFYVGMGILFGFYSIVISKLLFLIEDLFGKFRTHWVVALIFGGLAVGLIGFFDPRILGIGHDNIHVILRGNETMIFFLSLSLLKLLAWSIALASGTSGGTLLPIMTIGGAFGVCLTMLLNQLFPQVGLDPNIGGLIGMASVFVGVSHAFLACVVMAFELTRQPIGLLPLLGSCTAAYFVSVIFMKQSMMIQEIMKKGARVPVGYSVDFLDQHSVAELAESNVMSLRFDQTLGEVRRGLKDDGSLKRYQGFPIVDVQKNVMGVLLKRDILNSTLPDDAEIKQLLSRAPVMIRADRSMREAVDLMASEDIGRLIVISKDGQKKIEGVLTRKHLINLYAKQLKEEKDLDY